MVTPTDPKSLPPETDPLTMAKIRREAEDVDERCVHHYFADSCPFCEPRLAYWFGLEGKV